tara:strand:+ start:3253 stop:3780 length:528 start_codon:yes stop_codon:yes gene_type:complete
MLEEVAQILNASAKRPIGVMKNALNTKIRAGNKRRQTNTGKTANSIASTMPKMFGSILSWAFKSNESAVRLNNGGSLTVKGHSGVPYSGRGGGGQSAYIGALINWAKSKFGLNEVAAKKMAFAVAASASDRGRTVKATGWLDDAKRRVELKINEDMNNAIAIVVNKKINKGLNLK